MLVTWFYCKECDLDQERPCRHFTNDEDEECYLAICRKCRKELYRYISFPLKDPYYYNSKRVIMDLRKYAKDLIQPGDSRFASQYPKQYKELQEAKEEFEQKQIAQKKSRDEFYKKHRLNNKELIKKAFDIEDKIEYGKK